MTIICTHCGDPFEGRPNRAYCSTSCKSAVNNQRYAVRNYDARKVEREIRANRNILFKLYQLFGEQTLPLSVIKQTKLDARLNSGAASDGSRFCFLDFAIAVLSNQNFQILKSSSDK